MDRKEYFIQIAMSETDPFVFDVEPLTEEDEILYTLAYESFSIEDWQGLLNAIRAIQDPGSSRALCSSDLFLDNLLDFIGAQGYAGGMDHDQKSELIPPYPLFLSGESIRKAYSTSIYKPLFVDYDELSLHHDHPIGIWRLKHQKQTDEIWNKVFRKNFGNL